MNVQIVMENLIKEWATQSVARCIRIAFKRGDTKGKIMWWLEKQTRCNTHGRFFLSIGNEAHVMIKASLTFNVYGNAYQYTQIEDKIFGDSVIVHKLR